MKYRGYFKWVTCYASRNNEDKSYKELEELQMKYRGYFKWVTCYASRNNEDKSYKELEVNSQNLQNSALTVLRAFKGSFRRNNVAVKTNLQNSSDDILDNSIN